MLKTLLSIVSGILVIGGASIGVMLLSVSLFPAGIGISAALLIAIALVINAFPQKISPTLVLTAEIAALLGAIVAFIVVMFMQMTGSWESELMGGMGEMLWSWAYVGSSILLLAVSGICFLIRWSRQPQPEQDDEA